MLSRCLRAFRQHLARTVSRLRANPPRKRRIPVERPGTRDVPACVIARDVAQSPRERLPVPALGHVAARVSRNLVRADDVNDESLSQQALHEPAGLRRRKIGAGAARTRTRCVSSAGRAAEAPSQAPRHMSCTGRRHANLAYALPSGCPRLDGGLRLLRASTTRHWLTLSAPRPSSASPEPSQSASSQPSKPSSMSSIR